MRNCTHLVIAFARPICNTDRQECGALPSSSTVEFAILKSSSAIVLGITLKDQFPPYVQLVVASDTNRTLAKVYKGSTNREVWLCVSRVEVHAS
ncbi:hypothetical protein MPTK1_6g10680 [Marchantia polymorpha subsp. ruderalis]|uniref:Uncharacterized protein n=2 Tax=Marchantia polymorpha TaxID=3197 RepID=A0AAF6BQN8_MARPO|nr:hypothetical protein MARPO_0016s0109 [Marchantia polymorpha]BBN14322.1 hypothetical protein Mp_6g10680 [Marchantia polymorpha subsp. ruderalis]|eukprot:PTQ45056.1 hypothetical protein MARPO_0016s0109 [Marchantia polymorpha]